MRKKCAFKAFKAFEWAKLFSCSLHLCTEMQLHLCSKVSLFPSVLHCMSMYVLQNSQEEPSLWSNTFNSATKTNGCISCTSQDRCSNPVDTSLDGCGWLPHDHAPWHSSKRWKVVQSSANRCNLFVHCVHHQCTKKVQTVCIPAANTLEGAASGPLFTTWVSPNLKGAGVCTSSSRMCGWK